MTFYFGGVYIDAKQVLGKSDAELQEIINLPVSDYIYNQQGVSKIYTYGSKTLTVEFADGLVHKIGHVHDRRGAVRITPDGVKTAYLEMGDGTLLTSYILEMSIKSLSFQLDKDAPVPIKGTTVRFCTNLDATKNSRIYIKLSGTVYHVKHGGIVVVILETGIPTMSYMELARYIERHIAMKVLMDSGVTMYPAEETTNISIIKSDQCSDCLDRFCGIR